MSAVNSRSCGSGYTLTRVYEEAGLIQDLSPKASAQAHGS